LKKAKGRIRIVGGREPGGEELLDVDWKRFFGRELAARGGSAAEGELVVMWEKGGRVRMRAREKSPRENWKREGKVGGKTVLRETIKFPILEDKLLIEREAHSSKGTEEKRRLEKTFDMTKRVESLR